MQAYPTFDPQMIAAVRALLAKSTGAPVNTASPQMPYPTFNVQPQNGEYGGAQFGVGHTTRPADAGRVTDEGDDPKLPTFRMSTSETNQPQQDLPTFDAEKAQAAVAAHARPAQSSQYERDAAALRDLYSTPPENTDSRLAGAGRLAAYQASQEARQSDSLGRVAGAGLGGLLTGLLNKRADEQTIDRPQQIARSQAQLGVDAEAEKQAQAQREGEARIRLANANAANAEALPVFRTEEQIRREKEAEGRKAEANARLLASLYGKLPEFDPNAPENAELVSAMREAKVPVVQKRAGQQIHLVHDEKNSGWTVVAADKYTGSASSAPVKTSSGGQLSTTSSSQVASSDRAADRASREREAAANRASRESVARLVVASREKVSAVNQEMQRDRQRLRESAFRIQYPGYGKTLTHDDIVTKYNEFKQTRPNLTLEETVQAAIDQGYTVQP